MTPEAARTNNRTHGFIDCQISRAILKDIVQSEFSPPASLYKFNPELIELHSRYWKIRNKLPKIEFRNLPFYIMIKESYEDFDWEFSDFGVITKYTYGGLKPSLLSFLLGLVPKCSVVANQLTRLSSDIDAKLQSLFYEIGVVMPIHNDFTSFDNWVSKGLKGEPLVIVSPVCPDYAVEPIENEGEFIVNGQIKAHRHRFTFTNLGYGVGVTAAHLFKALPLLHKMLNIYLDLNVRYLVLPGDFEGFSQETCARLGIDEKDFLERALIQSKAIARTSPIPVESYPFTDLCGGRSGWISIWQRIFFRFFDGDLRNISKQSWVRAVALSRRSLYDRWYGFQDQNEDFYYEMVLRQGAEYAAMGEIIALNPSLTNPLILGADDHKMGRFYSLAVNLPVIYLKRNYE